MSPDESDAPMAAAVDFAALYDEHPDYVARRQRDSFEQSQIDIEVQLFKLPNLLALLPEARTVGSALEIGCATGELIAGFPVRDGGRKVGMDISAANIAAAQERFPQVAFRCADFRALADERFDVVILSDVLEHVPDDVDMLRAAAALADTVLVNLPLEDNWLNRRRRYGSDDVSGHLRKYSLAQGLALVKSAGLVATAHRQIWVHETNTESARRALRRERCGSAYSGTWRRRWLSQAVFAAAIAVRPLGRRLFASNLFIAARPATAFPAAHGSAP